MKAKTNFVRSKETRQNILKNAFRHFVVYMRAGGTSTQFGQMSETGLPNFTQFIWGTNSDKFVNGAMSK